MNPERKAEWIAALRSGEYRQGSDYLARTDADGNMTYCCLGVLCDLAVKAGVDVQVVQSMNNLAYDGQISVTPDSVAQWAGLPDQNPTVIVGWEVPDGEGHTVSFSLAEMNDGSQTYNYPAHTFEQIAQAIEENL